jgi:hypothetical protein
LGALQQPLHTPEPSQKKQPNRASRQNEPPKHAHKPREWKELDRNLRAGTDYDTVTGWAPMYGAFIADLLGLSSGAACTHLLLICLHNLGRKRKGSEPLPEETDPLSVAELSSLLECDERHVNRVLEYLADPRDKKNPAPMAVIARLKDSRVVIRLLYRTWHRLKRYKPWLEERQATLHDAAIDEDKPEESEDQPVKSGTVNLTRKPERVSAGHRSRAIPVTTGVRTYRFEWQCKRLDIQFTAAVQSGELICRVQEFTGASKTGTTDEQNKAVTGKSGHICPETPRKRGVEGKEKEPTPEHPRAAELCALFDPYLKLSKQFLSTDPASLSAACAELGDLSHEDLAAAVQRRAKTPINSPKHCAAIVRDAKLNRDRAGQVADPPATAAKPKRRTLFDLDREIREEATSGKKH